MLATLEAKIISAFAIFGLLAIVALGGYWYGEKAQKVKDDNAGLTQGIKAKAADVKNQGDANVSLDQYHKDVQAVNDYYHAHPVVRVRVVNGACTMPEAPDNSKVPDGAAPALYASAYDPAEVERVAARLDELQKRLVEAGVTVTQ